jgi:hypothetical protein
MKISPSPMENYMEVPQKTKNRTTSWSLYMVPQYITKEVQDSMQYKYLDTPVYWSTIHNSQVM